MKYYEHQQIDATKEVVGKLHEALDVLEMNLKQISPPDCCDPHTIDLVVELRRRIVSQKAERRIPPC
ncbi:MAG: hypothetical protein IIB57_08505 [Planctomycetes bacterium]|nr:hypothetical protein [Planctomycetota bacterium]